jgi:mannopine transport system permease protein
MAVSSWDGMLSGVRHRLRRPRTASLTMEAGEPGQATLLLLPVILVMLVAFLAPLGFVLFNSIYANALTLRGFRTLAGSTLFWRVLGTSFDISLTTTVCSLLVGYPVALYIARQPPRRRALLLIIVMIPFWTSILVKSFAFTIILGNQGIINQTLVWLFGEAARVKLLFNRAGVIIALTHNMIPYVVFPVLANLLAQDRNLVRAAQLMGAGPVRIFWRITLPLSMPGVVAAGLIVMVLSMGMFVTPALLGGRRDMMIANLVDFYTRETLDWNMAACIAVVLLVLSLTMAGVLARVRRTDALI